MTTRLRHHAHSTFRIWMHIVLVTKYRKKVITPEILERLKEIFSKLCLSQKCDLAEFNGESDHVHLLIDMAPDISVSKLVNILKTISSREIRREFSVHVNQFYWKSAFWTTAYCALSAGGAPLDVLRTYIQNQNEPEPVSSEDPVRH